MEQPPDFVAQGELGKVWRLKNSLYGESSHQELGLDDLSLLFGFLVFFILRRITLCFGDNIKGGCYFL